jgi:hypothetical protein
MKLKIDVRVGEERFVYEVLVTKTPAVSHIREPQPHSHWRVQ